MKPVPVVVPAPPMGQIDMRELCHAVGFTGARPLAQGRYRRLATQVEPSPVAISGAPLPVYACLDGTQAHRLMVRWAHRDVALAQIVAGAVDVSTRGILALEERLVGICSYVDAPALSKAYPGLPLAELDEHHPWEIPLAASSWVGAARGQLERAVLDSCPPRPGSFLVLDGPLPPDGTRTDVIGAIKVATDTDWLSDPGMIPMQGGWRSPALLLPAAGRGERDRFTALVRLRTCGPAQAWTYSLVRVEVYAEADLTVLDAAAALVVAYAGGLGGPDPRAEIQMSMMHTTEQVLKARITHFLTM